MLGLKYNLQKCAHLFIFKNSKQSFFFFFFVLILGHRRSTDDEPKGQSYIKSQAEPGVELVAHCHHP